MKIAVYGLFDCAGRCLYVGRTRNPQSRQFAHVSQNTVGQKFTFSILRRVEYTKASAAERRWILRFQKIGEAQFNKSLPRLGWTQIAQLNCSEINSEKLRKIQTEYKKRFAPAKVSLESLANLAIELGADKVRMKLNLT